MIRVAQIGYGYWGHNVAKKLHLSQKYDFAYIVESDAKKRKEAEELYKDVEVVSDYVDVLKDVEAVVVCTQTEYSFDIIMQAFEQGKHVFTEKPLAKDLKKADVLIEAAHKAGTVLHCDHLMIYNPIIQYIKKMIDSGEMGEITYIDVARVNLGPIRKDIDAMLDLAVHDIAVADYLLDGIKIDYLSACGTRFAGNQETITYLTIKSKDTLININSSWISPVKVRRTVIGGTKKMVVFDDTSLDEKLKVYDKGIEVIPSDVYGEYEFSVRSGDVYIPNIPNSDSLLNSINHFADCIESKRQSLSGPEQCRRVMDVLDRAEYELNNNKC